MIRTPCCVVAFAFLVVAPWIFHSYRHGVLDSEFLAYGQSARPPEITEKGHTVRITIESARFVGKVETGNPVIVNQFQVLTRPGADAPGRSLIVDWTKQLAAPPLKLEQYRVSFYLVGYALPYVMLY